MTLVRMLVQRTGSRHDHQEWPDYLGTINVPDWEAEDLLREHQAQPADAPVLNRGWGVLKAADPDFESKLDRTDGEETEEEPTAISSTDLGEDDFDSDFDRDDFDRDDSDPEVAAEPEMKRPTVADKKASWIEWAVHNGANGNEAEESTKAQLIEEYGSL